jgi:hypothetical protein
LRRRDGERDRRERLRLRLLDALRLLLRPLRERPRGALLPP